MRSTSVETWMSCLKLSLISPLARVARESPTQADSQHGTVRIIANALSGSVKDAHLYLRKMTTSTHNNCDDVRIRVFDVYTSTKYRQNRNPSGAPVSSLHANHFNY